MGLSIQLPRLGVLLEGIGTIDAVDGFEKLAIVRFAVALLEGESESESSVNALIRCSLQINGMGRACCGWILSCSAAASNYQHVAIKENQRLTFDVAG